MQTDLRTGTAVVGELVISVYNFGKSHNFAALDYYYLFTGLLTSERNFVSRRGAASLGVPEVPRPKPPGAAV